MMGGRVVDMGEIVDSTFHNEDTVLWTGWTNLGLGSRRSKRVTGCVHL